MKCFVWDNFILVASLNQLKYKLIQEYLLEKTLKFWVLHLQEFLLKIQNL